jgi:hypothetical protein
VSVSTSGHLLLTLLSTFGSQAAEHLDGQARDGRGLERDRQRHPTLAGQHHRQRGGLDAEFSREGRLGAVRVVQPLLNDVFSFHSS